MFVDTYALLTTAASRGLSDTVHRDASDCWAAAYVHGVIASTVRGFGSGHTFQATRPYFGRHWVWHDTGIGNGDAVLQCNYRLDRFLHGGVVRRSTTVARMPARVGHGELLLVRGGGQLLSYESIVLYGQLYVERTVSVA